MSKTSWGKPEQNIIIELRAKAAQGKRYWLARFLILIAAKLLNSDVISKRTLPVLEAE